MIKDIVSDKMEASVKREASFYGIKKVGIALSGGADSISIGFILKKLNLNIIALHCNFHLRGEESKRDSEFVNDFCLHYNLPLLIKDFDVSDYLTNHPGESIEMACRNLRYEWFFSIKEELELQRIVTGHNADDNIETFFINALRGSGTRGLKGMESDNGKIWRPLLKFHKTEILAYIDSRNLSYVTDSSNLESDFRRNFLRNKIIPLLRKEWKGFDKALDKTINNLATENKVVEANLENMISNEKIKLQVDTIISFPAPLLIIKRFIDPLGPYTSTPEEILSAIKANKPHIRRWRLKKGNLILRNGALSIEMGHSK